MSAARTLVAGVLICVLSAAAAVAEPARIGGPEISPTVPQSRQDVLRDRLAGVTPRARPVWMIRYPVEVETSAPALRPAARPSYLMPKAQWDFRRDSARWTRAAMAALSRHGAPLASVVPEDIAKWCPAYDRAGPVQRRAFWVGLMSALAKHESTWNPAAVGGGGQWFGLLQIYPPTARGYGCQARTGAALQNPVANLSCAIRIMAVTVARDEAIAVHDGRWRGVAADWGPMTSRSKQAEMASWTRAQPYCRPQSAVTASIRPSARPQDTRLSTMGRQ